MNEIIKELEVSPTQGRAWFEESLGRGFDLSTAVLSTEPLTRGRFLTFVSKELAVGDIEFPHAPDAPTVATQSHLAKYLDDWTKDGASCFLFEDDVVERGDPAIERWSIPSAFVGTRVVHWSDLGVRGGAAAVESINSGAFGYPLNAFVLSCSAEELGLAHREPVSKDSLIKVTQSLLGIVVSAFDATSFAIWDKR